MGKIKELWNVDKRFDQIEQSLTNISTAVVALGNHFKDIKEDLKAVRQHASNTRELLDQTIAHTQQTTSAFQEELDRFRGLKRQLQQEFIARGEQELSKTLNNLGSELRTDHKEYKDVQGQVMNLATNASELQQSMEHLQNIIKTIKKEDFQMNRIVQNVKMSERERHELLRKIDQLERLVATRRRRNQHQSPQRRRVSDTSRE